MRPAFFLTSLATLLACQGIEGSASDLDTDRRIDGLGPCTSKVVVGPAPMRRLSHDEYRFALADALGDPSLASLVASESQKFVADTQSLGFRNSATFLDVKAVLAQGYMDAAEVISTAVAEKWKTFVSCTESGDGKDCATQLINTLGKRLYRRALASDEVAAYQKVYTAARTAKYDYKTGIQWAIFAMLQSPGFLYRVELDVAGDPEVRKVKPLELASRLSFLFWQSGPDQTLLDAAEAGRLATSADVEREAQRLLADPRSKRLFDFFEQWLVLGRLNGMSRDTTMFPNLNPQLPSLLMGEVEAFVNAVVFDGDAKVSTLLTAPYTYVNKALATHYGLSGVTSDTYQKVSYPAGRAGLLMMGGVLASNDNPTRTSIIRRGVGIRTRIMCQVIPAPGIVPPALGAIDGKVSQAERLAQHRQDPNCASCHLRIDSLGSPFEEVDAVGRTRTVDEGGLTVKPTGEITGSADAEINGTVADGLEMVTKLAQSNEVQNCVATQLYRFSFGRKEEEADVCSNYQARQRFKATSGDLRELMAAMTQMDNFLYRRITPPSP